MSDSTTTPESYVVVARRYRPQTFEALIGQEHVAKALSGAIVSHRVGHAYLFTGARGVGKTSAARILAKALNCARGMSAVPCNECEVCNSVAGGDDVDVIEIDGASNRGIDEIRQLRQNVAVRPSRSRFKIYIIDEVHMLSKAAFNALLKTLEEPPEHVKFIFATTEVQKIPITILSRCQRYDFAGIEARSIERRLAEIATAEGVEIEEEAVAIIAMRAAGSMRDSQSLLEQLLSTGAKQVTSADVTALLGLAPASRLSRLVRPLIDRDAATALAELDGAVIEGAEVGQLIDQLLGYFRDAMTQAVGCGEGLMLYALPSQREEVREVARQMGVESLLAVSQILDHAAARMRISTQVRTLTEMALVRICQLGNLDDLAVLIESLKSGESISSTSGAATTGVAGATNLAGVKKNSVISLPRPHILERVAASASVAAIAAPTSRPSPIPAKEVPPPKSSAPPSPPLAPEDAERLWKQTLELLSGMVYEHAAVAERFTLSAEGQLTISFPGNHEGKFARECCQRSAALPKIEAALADAAGRPLRLVMALHDAPAADAALASTSPHAPQSALKQREVAALAAPFVQKAVELFAADSTRLRYIAPPE